MRVLNIILPATLLVVLSGCMDSTWIGGGNAQYLKSETGLAINCQGNHMYVSPPPSEADEFWQENNLPKGTAKFVCKDGKAYLPNKVTDCKGNNISKQAGGLTAFKEKNNFPRYSNGKIVWYTIFECKDGKVIPTDYTNQ